MKFKLSGLGILSLVLYVVLQLWNANNATADPTMVVYGYDPAFMNRVSYGGVILGLLSIIPAIDFFLKAFKKHYRGEDHEISMLSIILTVLSLGIPFFTYAFVSFIMKVAFGSREEYTSEKWGFVIGTIFTLGFVWLIVFLALGPTIFMYRKVVNGIYSVEEASTAEMISLILATILTLGILWIVLGIGVVFARIFFLKAWNTVMNDELELSSSTKVWGIILSILTLGILPIASFTAYFTYELFLYNAEGQVL